MKELKNGLLQILSKMAKVPNIEKFGTETESGGINYIPYLITKLAASNINVLAKEVIRMMETIQIETQTAPEIKVVIEQIFSTMDLRDQNYRYGECDCASCQFLHNPTQENLEKALKSINELEEKTKNNKIQ